MQQFMLPQRPSTEIYNGERTRSRDLGLRDKKDIMDVTYDLMDSDRNLC